MMAPRRWIARWIGASLVRDRWVLVVIIVGSIRGQDLAQVRFTEHDHVVQAFPVDRADEPLNVPVLPR